MVNRNFVEARCAKRVGANSLNLTIALAGVFLAGIFISRWYYSPTDESASSVVTDSDQELSADPEGSGLPSDTIQLPETQWELSGIRMEPVVSRPFEKRIDLTGRISLNQDRIAHIYPMVEGTVDQVFVGLGEEIKANDKLVVIHSREIGEAKLRLYQARLSHEIAVVKDQLQKEIAANSRELITALREQRPVLELEPLFRSRSMGDYRERLLAAYSNFLKSQADVTRLEGITASGAVSGKQLLAAEANRNADLATFQARIEQIEYEITTALLLSSQAVKQAETEIAVSATSLRILGVDEEDIASVDPAEQGETISHYTLRAPFDGIVITKDVVLREQVRPDVLVMSVADLNSVWISADVYQEHISLLRTLENQEIEVRSDAWPGEQFSAKVFYTGEIMDEATRTISLRAVANNPEKKLKPGMFVTVSLPGESSAESLQVPLEAVQEHAGTKFVFVHSGGDSFRPVDVTLGASNATNVMVVEGLQAGDSVVTAGGFILKSLMLEELMGEE